MWLAIICSVFVLGQVCADQNDGSVQSRKAIDLEIFKVYSWSAVETHDKKYLEDSKQIEAMRTNSFGSMNISKAMGQLGTVGKLIQLAYASSKGFPSSTVILNGIMNYQSFVKNSLVTTISFVDVSIKALKYHNSAMKNAYKGGARAVNIAVTYLKFSMKLAQRMSDKCDELIAAADVLIDHTNKAIDAANKDEVRTKSEKEETEKLVAELRANQEKQRVEREGYKKKINELKAKLREAIAKKASIDKKINKRKFKWYHALTFVASPVTGTIWTTYNQLSKKSLKGQSSEIQKIINSLKAEEIKYTKSLIQASGELKKLASQVGSTTATVNTLKASIELLSLTIQTLGKIKTVFEDARLFWKNVQKMTKNRADDQDELQLAYELGDTEMLTDYIRNSGYEWYALAKVNMEGAKAVSGVDGNMDKIVRNLPSMKEANEMAKKLSANLTRGFDEEQLELQNTIKELENL